MSGQSVPRLTALTVQNIQQKLSVGQAGGEGGAFCGDGDGEI
jgi:hypothetical protein